MATKLKALLLQATTYTKYPIKTCDGSMTPGEKLTPRLTVKVGHLVMG